MTERYDSRQTTEQVASGRRRLLKKGLLAAGAGVTLSPVEVALGSSREDTLNHRSFEIWAADHIEVDYQFEAEGPIQGVTDPRECRGAEPGPDGNDDVRHLGGSTYRISGTTGFGCDDTWQVSNVHRIITQDSRTR